MEILIVVLAAYGVWQFSEFEKFKKAFAVKLSKVGFDFQRSLKESFKSVWINVTLTVNNPTQLEQSLSAINLTASYNEKTIGSVNMATVIKLKTGENVYIIPVALSTINLFGGVAQAIKAFQEKKGISLSINGNVKVGEYNLPIKENVKVA